jgi:hypothetical protein
MDARVVKPLVAAGLCAVGLVAIGAAVFGFDAARSLDVRALDGFMGLGDRARVQHGATLAQFADPLEFAAMVLALVAAAAVRRRPRLAVTVALVPVLSAVSAEALKLLTAAPRGTTVVDASSWPSGHVAAMTSLGLCLILVAPPRLRPVAAALAWIGTVGIAYDHRRAHAQRRAGRRLAGRDVDRVGRRGAAVRGRPGGTGHTVARAAARLVRARGTGRRARGGGGRRGGLRRPA